jgi:hypothetical protein
MSRCPVCNRRVIAKGDAIEVPVLSKAHIDGTRDMEFGYTALFHRYCYFRVKGILQRKETTDAD